MNDRNDYMVESGLPKVSESIAEDQSSLVELVVGTRNYQLYEKGKESRTEELNGYELHAQAYHPSRLIPVCSRTSRRGETFEQLKRRRIGEANPNRAIFNAYVIGDENGVDSPKVSVAYYKI